MDEKIRFRKEDIGGELLPILTTGLYKDPLDTLREYIQNGIDAGAKNIYLKVDTDQVVITDDGIGMTKNESRKAIRLGISDKNPLINIGFRGIGIYSSFNLCNQVEIYTKNEDDVTYKIFFDFKKIRTAIIEEQERRKNNLEPELFLEKLLTESVHIEKSDYERDTNGTKVILSGLLNDVFERLNNWHEVSSYLERVVPLPFKKNFKYAETIETEFQKYEYDTVNLFLKIGDKEEELFRPYSNDLFHHKGEHKVKFFDLKKENELFGFAWICINDERAVLRNKSMRGLVIKKRGFSINDRNFLESFFPRPVFYRRITGEIIILHKELIPNAARNDFEYNSTRQLFFQFLPSFIREVSEWANDIQEQDLAKDVLISVLQRLQEINNNLPTIRRNKEELLKVNNRLVFIQQELRPHRETLQKITEKKLKTTDELLTFCINFVTDELTKAQTDRKNFEKNVNESIANREKASLKKKDEKRLKEKPKNIAALIDAFGIIKDDEITNFIKFLDEQILNNFLSEKDYAEALELIENYLED